MTPDRQSEAEACFLKAIEIARRQEAKSLELRAVMNLVRLRQQQTPPHASPTMLNEARTMLSKIYGWFTEGFDTTDLQEAKALLNQPPPLSLAYVRLGRSGGAGLRQPDPK